MNVRVGTLVLLLALFSGCRTLDYHLVATEGVRSLDDPGRNTAVAEVDGVSYLVDVSPGGRGVVARLEVVNRTGRLVRLDRTTITVETSAHGGLWKPVETFEPHAPSHGPEDEENLRQEFNKLALQKGILPDAEFQRRESDLKARMERCDPVAPRTPVDVVDAAPGGRAELVLTFADTGASSLRLITVDEGSRPLVFVFRRVRP